DLLNRKFQELLAGTTNQSDLINRKFDALIAGSAALAEATVGELQREAGRLTAHFDQQQAEIGELRREAGRLAARRDEQHNEIPARLDEHHNEIATLRQLAADQQIQLQALLHELAEERSRRQRLETHDDIRAADLRNAGERIVRLQEQI